MKVCIRIVKNEQGGYTAICASLPGCVSTGQTPEDAREKLNVAIRGYLAAVSNCCPDEILQEVAEVS
ncbi:hypothetical protein LCGC14_0321340 [marine sediment metagenome]|uniref:HicB-like antitoxin of toxin-antitoxin system domain-containing protein n=1 Tax=marine sediment metagenome TaxID=412755 RepID=A0A0F9U1Z3_9ZZZZ|nr:type II toxin-antitoxin system HicB family antitoxin [Phycisphaerae bacterium]HDZ43248.1 type II toxin-antitoxin system HicB family antitoxin [Phycisphaerae bacterium]